MDHSHRVDLLSKMLDLDSPCVSDKMIAFLRQVRAMYVRVLLFLLGGDVW